MDIEIYRLLAPLKDELRALVLERERLVFKILDACVRFFQAAKRADAGPLLSDHERAERPRLHPFKRRGPGRQPLRVRRFFPLCNVQIGESPLKVRRWASGGAPTNRAPPVSNGPPVSEHDRAGFPELIGGEGFTL